MTFVAADVPAPEVTVTRGACHCGHPMPAVSFDPRDASEPADVVRQRWPRLDWQCPRCRSRSIAYASPLHYLAGDW